MQLYSDSFAASLRECTKSNPRDGIIYLLDGIAITIYSVTVNAERLAYLYPRQLRDAEDKLG